MSETNDGWRRRLTDLAEGAVIMTAAAALMLQPVFAGAWRRVYDMNPLWRRRLGLGIMAAVAVSAGWAWRDVPGDWLAHLAGRRPLYEARNWHYQLDKVDVDALAANPADVLVIDYATGGGKVPLTADQVARLKTRADGRRRFVISYMSIGEAEQFRYYFKPEWKQQPPEWLGEENCAWPGAHKVRFWHDGWKDLSWRGEGSYLKRIIDAGFDGVYLDRVDIYEMYPKRETARAEMIAFVKDLSAKAKAMRPGFLILPQNADALLVDRDYRAAIDGLGREDLINGAHETGKRNPTREIRIAQSRLDRLLWEWKPVLAVEYLQTRAAIADATNEMVARGVVPTFQPRALDGTDPTKPVDLTKDTGTAEYTKANCEPGKAW